MTIEITTNERELLEAIRDSEFHDEIATCR
jgi:hypothetical protein